ncbi:MAG: hypothetical protein QM692_24335 [Thermomicrobiales bacterium]
MLLELVQHTPTLADLGVRIRRRQITFPVPKHRAICNPSVARNPATGKLRVTVRSVNYFLTDQYTAWMDDPYPMRTINYVADVSDDLRVNKPRAIEDADLIGPYTHYPVLGFEDLRLFRYRDGWWAVANRANVDHRHTHQMQLLRLRGAHIAECIPLTSATNEQLEKNWMPAIDPATGDLRLIYSCNPAVVLRYDHDTRTVEPEAIHPAPQIAAGLRGGTQAIPFDGGYLCLTHDFARRDGEYLRTYFHRWLWFAADWRIGRVSQPFFLQRLGIEFACGLVRTGKHLLISYGVWDREAWLARVPVADVRTLLQAPLTPDAAQRRLHALQARFPP